MKMNIFLADKKNRKKIIVVNKKYVKKHFLHSISFLYKT